MLTISIEPTSEVVLQCSLPVAIYQFLGYLNIVLLIPHLDDFQPKAITKCMILSQSYVDPNVLEQPEQILHE